MATNPWDDTSSMDTLRHTERIYANNNFYKLDDFDLTTANGRKMQPENKKYITNKEKELNSSDNSTKQNGCLRFLRQNSLVLVTLVISILCIFNFWFTHNFWTFVRYRNIIEPDSRAYRLFEKIPMEDMNLCITIFNYTNVPEYNENISIPLKVKEVGPICWNDIPGKKNLEFEENESVISFQENSKFKFYGDVSLEDIIYVPNIPLFSVFHHTSDHNALLRFGFWTTFKIDDQEPFIQLKIDEFVNGYDDELLASIQKLTNVIGYKTPKRFSMLDSIRANINSNYSVYTGKSDIDQTGFLKTYNGKSKLDVWKTEECNEYQGSYGANWSPDKIRKGENMSFFNGFLCRNVPLVKEKDVTDEKLSRFITLARYQVAPDLFTYPSSGNSSQDSCYCIEEPCIPNLFYVGKCLDGPFVLSYKNFYAVDKKHLSYLDLDGLEPMTEEKDDWKSFFDIHPGIGSTMKFKTTFQMNVQVRKTSRASKLPSKMYENGLVYPVVVIQRDGQKLNLKTRLLLITLSVVETLFQYGSIVVVIVCIFIMIRRKRRSVTRPPYVYQVTVSSPIIPYEQAPIQEVVRKVRT